MANPISALGREPYDLIREVSPEAISFYVDELSGIYLPEAFKEEHKGRYSIDYWEPEDRLRGKFGRFAVRHRQEEEADKAEFDDILLMGTTIGLSGLDRYGDLESLRHYSFQDRIRTVLEERDLIGAPIRIDRADYGDTTIILGEGGTAETLRVGGSSYDFGRARAEGRQITCELFEGLLGETVKVINDDPEPEDYERIVEG